MNDAADDLRLLAFDTETTGLTLHPDADARKQPKVIEFGAMIVSLQSGQVLREISLLINPGEDITPEITKITGITNEQLATAPSFRDVVGQIREAFAQCVAMVAHNLPFDRDIIRYEVDRWSLASRAADDWPWPAGAFCTMNLYTPLWGRPPRLIEIYQAVMGKEYPQTHRALDDVRAMVEVIQKDKLWEVMK